MQVNAIRFDQHTLSSRGGRLMFNAMWDSLYETTATAHAEAHTALTAARPHSSRTHSGGRSPRASGAGRDPLNIWLNQQPDCPSLTATPYNYPINPWIPPHSTSKVLQLPESGSFNQYVQWTHPANWTRTRRCKDEWDTAFSIKSQHRAHSRCSMNTWRMQSLSEQAHSLE